MSLSRNQFEELTQERYLDISWPGDLGSLPQSSWYFKIAPLADLRQTSYQQYFLHSSDMTMDEMMVWLTGHSVYILLLQGKPTL